MTHRRRSLCPVAALAAAAALAGLLGCAAGSLSGRKLLAEGDYERAAKALAAEEAAHPNDARVKRDLGIALSSLGRNEEAAAKLEAARALAPRDAATLLQLGRVDEALGRDDEALEAYASYPGAHGKEAAALEARIEELTHRKIQAEIKAALASESSLDPASLPENSVAVLDFTPIGGDSTLAPLGKGLAAMLITDLRAVTALRVVERMKLRVLLDEIRLGAEGAPGKGTRSAFDPVATTRGQQQRLAALRRKDDPSQPYYAGAIDGVAGPRFTEAIRRFQADAGLASDGVPGEKTQTALDGAAAAFMAAEPGPASAVAPGTAPRVGALVGARRLVQGGFTPLAGDAVRVDASLTDVADATDRASAEADGKLAKFFEVEKDLLEKILSSMHVTLTPEERKEILREVPTRDFLAFLSYSRGLDYEDRGDSTRALSAYREALRRDSGFAAARERVNVLGAPPAAFDRMLQASLQRALSGAVERTRETLQATGGTLGQQMQENESQQSQIEPQAGGAPQGTVVVTGTLPQNAGAHP